MVFRKIGAYAAPVILHTSAPARVHASFTVLLWVCQAAPLRQGKSWPMLLRGILSLN